MTAQIADFIADEIKYLGENGLTIYWDHIHQDALIHFQEEFSDVSNLSDIIDQVIDQMI